MEDIRAYTVPRFCQIYGISRAQVFIEFREGRLKARKYGNRNLILAEDAEAWAKALPVRQAA
nr:DNA-binding protein [uncultured Devosia sp.]